MKTNKIISEIPYQAICRNYVVRIYPEKENIAIVLTLMLKEVSKNVVGVINGTYRAEIGPKMQTLDKIDALRSYREFIQRRGFGNNEG